MNARQLKKYLKKQTAKLQSDNDLMHRIIADSPKMQELYDAYTKPLNAIHALLSFQEVKVKRMIPIDLVDMEGIVEHTKQAIATDLLEGIKENIEEIITYEINAEHKPTSITGSIFIGGR